MNITVVGLGYVGLGNATLLATQHSVRALDLDDDRVKLVNARKSPLQDEGLISYFNERELDITATSNAGQALDDNTQFVIIATPTNYDPDTQHFDTSSVEAVLRQVRDLSPNATVIIKSTIPIGFTDRMNRQFPELSILFSPEFLREGRALEDNLFPSRIIVAGDESKASEFAHMMVQAAVPDEVPTLITAPAEAEAIKLFSNTYLAMRVAFFNELDNFAIMRGLNASNIVKGVSLDPRVGDYYNNPSFGYGGYCLPKDTKQLLADYRGIPQNLITAIVDSNETRVQVITEDILKRNPQVVGVFRLVMKTGSDNFRSSSISRVTDALLGNGITVNVYEPALTESPDQKISLCNDLDQFLDSADVIIANRMDAALEQVADKVYTRDVFGRD